MQSSHFSPDILEFIRLLSIHKVRYVKEKKYLVNFIGLEHLIKNKKAVKRFKDLDDLQYLTKLIKKE